jgi:excisionase family DNA binding protein
MATSREGALTARASFRPKRLVSVDVAAEYLDMNAKTIRRWVSSGRITGYRVGTKTLRVDLVEVDALAVPVPTVGTFGEAS